MTNSVRPDAGQHLIQRRAMSAQRLANDLAIADDIHAASHEADQLAFREASWQCPANQADARRAIDDH